MGVQITRSFGELSKRLKKGCLEPTMRKVSKYLVSSAVGKINKNIPPENAPLTQKVEASEKGSILEKLVLFMPKNVKKTH